jgi:acyl-CoA thioesterase
VSARLRQGDQDLLLALCAVGSDRRGPELHDHPAPEVPSPEATPVPVYPEGAPAVPMRERYETRPCIGAAPFTAADEALTGGWIRTAEDDPLDSVVVAAFTDAWVPAVFAVVQERMGVPTVELTIHFRNVPPAGSPWCLVRFRTLEVSEGYLEETGEVWSEDGTLLAESRQLAVVLAAP